MAWNPHWIKTPNVEDLVPPLVVHVANPSCAYLRWVGALTEEHTTLSHKKTRKTSFEKWKWRKFAAHSLEVHFSNPLHRSTRVTGGLQCSFGWPPWPRWSASERFGSAPQHDTFGDTLPLLKCWGHEWNFRVGHHSISNLTSFVYVSLVSLMLWHCIHLSKQPPSKGLKWFWVSGITFFCLKRIKKSCNNESRYCTNLQHQEAQCWLAHVIDGWRRSFQQNILNILELPSSHPKRRHRLWRFHINEEGTTQSLSGHSESVDFTD